jgi:bifunctional non-homologous end joining protein LigD
VTGALETPDGTWRVEIVQRNGNEVCRLVHGHNVIDGLSIEGVDELLAKAGVNIADLVDASQDARSHEPDAA